MTRVVSTVALLVMTFLAAPPVAEAQQPGRVYRIGYLLPTFPLARLPSAPTHLAFTSKLRELGYEEGRNLVLDIRGAEGKLERLPDLAAELVQRKPDLLVAPVCGPGLVALRRATSTLPILVQTCQDDMVKAGIVASLAHPGGNVTGISKAAPEWAAKKLQLLKEAAPSASRVAVLWDPTYSDWTGDWREIRRAAHGLGVTLESVEMRGRDDLDRALSTIRVAHVDAILSFSDVTTFSYSRRVGEFALGIQVPILTPFRDITAAGGLMSFGPNIVELFSHSATFVDKILKGVKPADIPVEQPTKFELVINLKTAKTLGLTIPPAVLARADEVIQ